MMLQSANIINYSVIRNVMRNIVLKKNNFNIKSNYLFLYYLSYNLQS